jgi:hypothetical protein
VSFDVREVRPQDYTALGELTVAAFRNCELEPGIDLLGFALDLGPANSPGG